MAKAGEKPIPFETPIPISEAASRVLKSYPAWHARPLMMQRLADGRIRCCAYRELVGHRAGEPTPDQPAFWRPDPRGQTRLTRFPWPGDSVRRLVQPRGYRRPLANCAAFGLEMVWEDVVAEFPDAAGPAHDSSEARGSNPPGQKHKGGAKQRLRPEQIDSAKETYRDMLVKDPGWADQLEASARMVLELLDFGVSWHTVKRHIIMPVLNEKQRAK